MLANRQKITLTLPTDEWLQEASTGSGVTVLPLSCRIAQISATLPEHHKDPADRFIIATAMQYDFALMSLDEKFKYYEPLAGRLITS